MLSCIQGFPRIGAQRQLKFALEAFWRGELEESDLERKAAELRAENYRFLTDAGLDLVPVGDFSYYDRVLDTCCMVGAVPERFSFSEGDPGLAEYFALARGVKADSGNIRPLSMLKWFNTNYHYLVGEFSPGMKFAFRDRRILHLVDQALEAGVPVMPTLIGPVSFLLLGRAQGGFDPLDLLDDLLAVYREVLKALAAKGVKWIQLEEPCFAQDTSEKARQCLRKAYEELAAASGSAAIVVQTYFDNVGENFQTLAGLPVAGLGLDFVHGPENLQLIQKYGWPGDKVLFAGVVDGRNIWVCDPDSTLAVAERLKALAGREDNLVLSTSCSLMHVPVTVEGESRLPEEVSELMAFAREKVCELVALARTISQRATGEDNKLLDRSRRAIQWSRKSSLRRNRKVCERLAGLAPKDFRRSEPYSRRKKVQARELNLPLFPTTTIGSFPQTAELRRLRARLRKGGLTGEDYKQEIMKNIASVVRKQQELGIDVLVHGEFERNDMVEYFGEMLDGYYFTSNGWVLSYGSRGVKPPVIYGDISRRGPMTVQWSSYAQSLTDRPMKGMLTGPVTMLNWSFVRDDIPPKEVCWQLALAIRDEVDDLVDAGIRVVQIDEPALREGLPLQQDKQAEYLNWAVDAFRLASSGASSRVQIHSPMCYSDLNSIYDQIIAMDADVISIENSRAGGRLLKVFKQRRYPNGIGPGVWDIHSPLVPGEKEIVDHLHDILRYLSPESVWVNPDCGLKTRGWEEVDPSLVNMVNASMKLRAEYSKQ